jgi:hypothetical protein
MNIISLNSKEIIKDLLLRLPDDISLHQIAQEIESKPSYPPLKTKKYPLK